MTKEVSTAIKVFIPAVIILLLFLVGSQSFVTVPVGHVAVATLFGKVKETPYTEGLHIPVNPLYEWSYFDIREKTILEHAGVPSQDQLQTSIDISIQYSLIGSAAPHMLQETGLATSVVEVHLVPKFRSVIRELGKTIEKAEDFYSDSTQAKLQTAMLLNLQEALEPKGINVTDILIRDITLPEFIEAAIEQKKIRLQQGEEQKAELERFTTEQQQHIVLAEAQRAAAEKEAEMIRLLADAEAYRISQINLAIQNNSSYIQLQAMEALKAISKDSSSKIYFMNGDSPSPLPLMNMGR